MKNRSKLFISIFLALLFFNLQAYPEDNLLTIKQQLDRLQREVNDISKSVFTNTKIQSNNKDDSSSNETINFAAIDMRIYDLEKDIKNLTMNLEEIVFQLDEIQNKIINIEQVISDQLEKIDTKQSQEEVVEATSENTLGKLQISSNNNVTETRAVNEDVNEEDTSIEESQKLLPEEQFQIAFGKIRKKQYKEAK